MTITLVTEACKQLEGFCNFSASLVEVRTCSETEGRASSAVGRAPGRVLTTVTFNNA